MNKRFLALAVAAVAVVAIIAAAVLLMNGGEKHTDPSHTIVSGDKVSVDYIGTYYAYYGEANCAVFDTSIQSVAEDESAFKSCDYSKRPAYSPLEFEVDDGKLLKKFNDAVVGHKAGDVVRTYLTAEEGYVAPVESGTLSVSGNSLSRSYHTTSSVFSSLYGDVKLVPNVPAELTTTGGWPGIATLYDDNMVTLLLTPVAGETYKAFDNGKTTAYYVVTAVEDDSITFDIDVRNPVYVDGNSIQMVKLDMVKKADYITGIDGSSLQYKTGGERYNQPLYFEIRIVSVNA